MTEQPKTAAEAIAPTISLPACLAVLKPLARRGAYLAQFGTDRWGLYRREKDADPSGGKLPVGLVVELERAGLIELSPAGKGRISAAGRAWLTRQLASSDPVVRQHNVHQVQTVAHGPGQTGEVLVNLGESPLAWLRTRTDQDGKALISEAEFAAGERLRRDFTASGLMPKVTAT